MNPVSATQTISEPEKQPAFSTPIDLRSDTVTKPSPEMRRAMAEAEVGDDVYLEDPTINKLQARAAEIFGREAALFVPSGSMGNLVAMKCWTQPGNEIIVEDRGHIHQFEMDSISAVCGCMPRTTYVEDGIMTWEIVEPLIRPKVYYRAQTALVSLESSHNMAGGTVYPPEVSDEICDRAHDAGLRVHLDGARIFNAATYLKRSVAEITKKFDSVMFCLSKGLGAPVGSMLVGSREFIERARIYRKLFGGGMRQVGVLGAAGLIALEKGRARLHEDHANARYLAEKLAELPGIKVDLRKVQTNIVFFDVRGTGRTAAEISAGLAKRKVLANPTGKYEIRMLTHVDVNRAAIDGALAEFRALLAA
ncbi:MAG TPA: GntG family PLP-dependent aldolase [Candidatus Acidoferrales bacterium]|nr:GntG family PLP-dependent aldolase [Candidatus Acidoferrales bacterium]